MKSDIPGQLDSSSFRATSFRDSVFAEMLVTRLWVLFALLVVFGVGCGQTGTKKKAEAHLPRTHATHDSELKDWLARLKADSALPHQLEALRINESPNRSSFAGLIQKEETRSKTDQLLISDSNAEILVKDLREILRDGRVRPDELSQHRLSAQLNHYRSKIERVRDSLNQPFDPFVWKNTSGLLADSRYVTRCEGFGGLEILSASLAIKRGHLAEAIESLAYCGKIIRHLTRDDRLISRLTAVGLRNLWLQSAAHIINDPKSKKGHIEKIYQLLRLQMAQWPKERKVWIADRALGLCTYEMVRDGKYSALLSNDEFEELQKQGLDTERVQSVQNNVDNDEVYYLNTFGQILAKMRDPYFKRAQWLEMLEAKHAEMKLKKEYPRVALDLLLVDYQNAQYRIAKDRARCEAWILALGTALKKNITPYKQSPSSGASYSVSQIQGAINVSGLSPSEFSLPISCPIRLN